MLRTKQEVNRWWKKKVQEDRKCEDGQKMNERRWEEEEEKKKKEECDQREAERKVIRKRMGDGNTVEGERGGKGIRNRVPV